MEELTRRARAARDGERGARRAFLEPSRVEWWRLVARRLDAAAR